MSRNDPHFRLRLPAELKAKIEAAADGAKRSLNAEIVWHLQRSLSLDEQQATDREKLRRGEPIIPPAATSLTDYGISEDAIEQLDPADAEERLAIVRAQYERAIVMKVRAEMAAKRATDK